MSKTQESVDALSLTRFTAENPHPVLRINKRGFLVYANNASAPILKIWKIKVGERVPVTISETIVKILHNNHIVESDININKDIYEFTFVPILKNSYVNIYARNTTKRKQAEAALRNKADHLRILNEKNKEVLQIDKASLEKLILIKSTELIKVQLELERSKRLSDIGLLASTVAHELRNPLAAITMAAANIKRKAQNPELESNLKTIIKKVLESDQIINNLLFYTKLRPPKLEKVNICNIILECIKNAEKNYQNKVRVISDLASIQGLLLDADPLQLQEVFNNLLNNAYDAIERKPGKIEISVQMEQGFIRIFLKDNGVGIIKDNLENIFYPFFTTKSKGTGLGLTICSQIIKLHGGQLDLESKVGQGTTAIISLPKAL